MYTFKNANIHGYFKMLIFIIIVFAFYNGICDKTKISKSGISFAAHFRNVSVLLRIITFLTFTVFVL